MPGFARNPLGLSRMSQSNVLKLTLLAGFALLVGLHMPSPWRSSWPAAPSEPWARADGMQFHDDHHDHHDDDLVQVDVFGESLCPDTTHIMHGIIAPLFSNGIASLMKLKYHAYGKVRETAQGLQCQHGPMECKINRYLNCAQELHKKNQTDWFGYVVCVHGNAMGEIEGKASGECAEARGWSKEELVGCATGELGDKLERKAAEKTKEYNPSGLSFVPWAFVNHVSLGMNYDQLGKFVCAAYKGDSRPEACGQPRGSKLMRGRL